MALNTKHMTFWEKKFQTWLSFNGSKVYKKYTESGHGEIPWHSVCSYNDFAFAIFSNSKLPDGSYQYI